MKSFAGPPRLAWCFCLLAAACAQKPSNAERDAGAVDDGSDWDGAIAPLEMPPAPPEKLVTVKDGRFFDDGEPWRPVGVNYIYPHYAQRFYGHSQWDWVTVWGAPEFPEIDAEAAFESDFALMESRGINEIRLYSPQAIVSMGADPATYPTPERSYCARLNTVLDLAGEHGIHVTLLMPVHTPNPTTNFDVVSDERRAHDRMAYLVEVIDKCGLASRSEILAYAVDGEGEVEFPSAGRRKMGRGSEAGITLWNAWLVERYGSAKRAQQKWGETLALECVERGGVPVAEASTNGCPDLAEWDTDCTKRGTRVCPPRLLLDRTTTLKDCHGTVLLDEKGKPKTDLVQKWGADTKAQRAFMRFTDWLMNTRFRRFREILKGHDPYHLLATDSILQDGYRSVDIFLRREQTKYLDFTGVHIYHHQYTAPTHWTASTFPSSTQADNYRRTAAAIAWMNPGRRPVIIGEVGGNMLGNCTDNSFCIEGNEAQRASIQAALVPLEAQIAATGGARGLRWWWWRGQRPMGSYPDPAKPCPRDGENSDYGIVSPAGAERPAVAAVGATAAAFEAMDAVPSDRFVRRTANASLSTTNDIWLASPNDGIRLAARVAVAGKVPFRLSTQCSDTDTVTGPSTCIEGGTYLANCDPSVGEHCCQLVCFDSMFETVEVLGASGKWENARNGEVVTVAAGAPLQVRVSVGNVGESRWSAPKDGGNAKIALSGAGLDVTRVHVPAKVLSFDSTGIIEFAPKNSVTGTFSFTMKMVAEQRFFFGESVTVTVQAAP
jgi:hypothetical protein